MEGRNTSELVELGKTSLPPETVFYWHPGKAVTVEVTKLTGDAVLVRASKTYQLTKQDREQQESWDANLRNLNNHLAESFPQYQISVNQVNEFVPEATSLVDEITEAKEKAEQLLMKKDQLRNQIQRDRSALDIGIEYWEDTLDSRVKKRRQEYENTEDKVDRVIEYLDRKKREFGEWRRNGVILAYHFTVSTGAEIVSTADLEEAAGRHVTEAFQNHGGRVKQVLQGPHFKFNVEDVEEPQVFGRLEHTQLLNPDRLQALVQKYPDLEEPLSQLRELSVGQYEAYALQDLEVDGMVFERSKATPAQAVNGLVQDLESQNVTQASSVRNDGPFVGTVAGTQQVAGFDPVEVFVHPYLAGQTGSGKTYLKRVLLENAASLGHNVLSVDLVKRQCLSAAFPVEDHPYGQGRALNGDYYWPGNEKLLDWPENVSQLLDGVSLISFDETDETEREKLVTELLDEVYRSEFPDDNQLMLFVDEAHVLADEPRQKLISIVKEKRSDNVTVCLVTQNPKSFKRKYSEIREQTTTQFLYGEYTSYAEDFVGSVLDSKRDVLKLDQGQAILHGLNLDPVTVDVRHPFSVVGKPSDAMIEELDRRYRPEVPEKLGSSSTNEQTEAPSNTPPGLTSDEQEIVEWMHRYLAQHSEYEYVTASNTHRDGPASVATAKDRLEKLVEKDVVEKAEIERSYNKTTGYRPEQL